MLIDGFPCRRRSTRIGSFALLVGASFGASSAHAGGGGMSSGVVELSNVTIAEFPNSPAEAQDIWGYVSPSGREYALVCMNNQIAFVEVTDPTAPVVVDTEPRTSSLWSDIKTYGEYAFQVADGSGNGLNVYDLTAIDDGEVTFVTAYTGPSSDRFTIAHNIYINTDSGFAYLVGGSAGLVGIRMIDISKPTNPIQRRNWGVQGVHDIYVKTYTSGAYAGREVAFLAAENQGVTILDVTDKNDIQTIAPNLSYETVTYCHQLWPSEDDRYLFVNDELDELSHPEISVTTTYVFDIEDLDAASYIGSFTNGLGSTDHNLMVRGPYVYEANYHSGLRVYSIANIDQGVDQVEEIAYFDTFPGDDSAGFDGAWGVYTQLPSRNVIVSDISRGLFVFDVVAAVDPVFARFDDTAVADPAETDGVSWVSGDAAEALFVSNRDTADSYLVPGLDGSFEAVTDAPLVHDADGRSSLWIDVDADGDLDVYQSLSGAANRLLRNDGGTFVDITVSPLDDAGQGRGAAAADYDGDGDLDIFLANQGADSNRLFRNDGGGVWVDVADVLGVQDSGGSMGCAWADYDRDGDPDLAVANLVGENALFRNDDGDFVSVALTGTAWRSQAMSISWGDVDGDLDLDLYVANLDRQDGLYRNDGGDVFTNVTGVWGLPSDIGMSVGSTWGDADRDGTLDLFVTALTSGASLWMNDGDSFVDVSVLNFGDQTGVDGTGIATADFDRDGHLDVYVGNALGENTLYRNRGFAVSDWAGIWLRGPDANTNGIGARVEVYDGSSWQMREIQAGTGYLSQEPAMAFFGLPGGGLDSLRVVWPNGVVTDSVDVAANRHLIVFAPGVTPTEGDPDGPPPISVVGYQLYPNAPNPFNPSTRITYDLGQRSTVWLTVHDIGGRRVRMLVAGVAQREGKWGVSWDGLDDAGRPVASGVYRYRLRAGAFDETRTMTLLK